MSDRTIPFDQDSACESCGKKGAYDFMGDLLCGECAFPDEQIRSVEDIRAAKAESGAPLQPGASKKTCNHEMLSGLKCDKPVGHTGLHGASFRGSTGAPAMASGMSGAQGWQELPKSNHVEVSHKPEKLFTHSELTTLLERMARLVVQEIADNHEPERVETPKKEVYFRCRCGFRYRPYASFREHILEVLLTESKLQQLREAVERG